MTQHNLDSWSIKSLPFVWSPLQRPTNGDDLPDSLEFELGIDLLTGRIIQKENDEVKSALDTAYAKGSTLSGLMDDSGIGKQYAEDFLSFIYRSLSTKNLSGLKVLEIGCGNGYLLKRLKDSGAEVLGVEPGEHGQLGAKNWDVPIVHGVFPNSTVTSQFDVVVAFALLEHIEDPVTFLSKIKANLKPNGLIIVAVPDVEPYVENGDLSILFHEHWSFFERETLLSTIKLAGYKDVLSDKSQFGGSLYCAMGNINESVPLLPDVLTGSIRRAQNYIVNAQKNCNKFSSYCAKIFEKDQTLGIYVPGRVVNALEVTKLPIQNIRFFDDNPMLEGKYFPGINVSVECRKSLLDNPTDYVLIMSWAFGQKLVSELKRNLPINVQINTVSEILK
jgi:Methyltransferase domain/C-methyltransferase C-terminal domain